MSNAGRGSASFLKSWELHGYNPDADHFDFTPVYVKRGSSVKLDVQFQSRALSASEYTLALHEPEHQVAVLLVNRHRGQTLQRIASVETIVVPEFQNWLRDQNRSGSDVFIGMNPLKDGATSRTKESIREIRHVYLESRRRRQSRPLRTCGDSLTRRAELLLDTSPAKHQISRMLSFVRLVAPSFNGFMPMKTSEPERFWSRSQF